MTAAPESPYRAARRAFLAACASAQVDSIARVAGARGPDGKPLFLDSVALGPRQARKALLLAAGADGLEGTEACALLVEVLRAGLALPPDARLVLVHALNPFGFVWGRRENEDAILLADDEAGASWSLRMVRVVAGEDLAQVERLTVLAIGGGAAMARTLGAVLARPGLSVTVGVATGPNQVAAALAAL